MYLCIYVCTTGRKSDLSPPPFPFVRIVPRFLLRYRRSELVRRPNTSHRPRSTKDQPKHLAEPIPKTHVTGLRRGWQWRCIGLHPGDQRAQQRFQSGPGVGRVGVSCLDEKLGRREDYSGGSGYGCDEPDLDLRGCADAECAERLMMVVDERFLISCMLNKKGRKSVSGRFEHELGICHRCSFSPGFYIFLDHVCMYCTVILILCVCQQVRCRGIDYLYK